MSTVNLAAGANHVAHVPITFTPIGQAYTLQVGLYSDSACATTPLVTSGATPGTGQSSQVTLNTPSFAFPSSLGIVYVGVILTVLGTPSTLAQAPSNNVNMSATVSVGVITWD